MIQLKSALGHFFVNIKKNLIEFLPYRVNRIVFPTNFLSNIEGGKIPQTTRKTDSFPDGKLHAIVFILVLIFCVFVKDTDIKKFLLINLGVNIDGIGSLSNYSVGAWQVLATIISVGLATIGIILQALSQHTDGYYRKLLLHHYFRKQQLEYYIRLSFFVVILVSLVLVFKEKVFLYPWLSERVYFVPLVVTAFTFLYGQLILKSFNYLFPEKQDEYFRESLLEIQKWLIRESAKTLILHEVLELRIKDINFGIRYYYRDDNNNTGLDTCLIETPKKGKIIDINIGILSLISDRIDEKYINEEEGKVPLKAEIYVELWQTEKRPRQPLALIHKESFSKRIDKMFNRAIEISTKEKPSIQPELIDYINWIWERIEKEILSESHASEDKIFRPLYDFYDESLKVFSEYSRKYKLDDTSNINKWDIFVSDLKQRYFNLLENSYNNSVRTDSLFELNYVPFALCYRALSNKNLVQFIHMSNMIPWVYKSLAKSNQSRKKDLIYNFFLSNFNFGEFYMIGNSDTFKAKYIELKPYLEQYLSVQLNILKEAFICDDFESAQSINKTISELIQYSSNRINRNVDTNDDLSDAPESIAELIIKNWNGMVLGLQAWCYQLYLKEKFSPEKMSKVLHYQVSGSLDDLTETCIYAIRRELDDIVGWDWWEFEPRPFVPYVGSIGGFEHLIAKVYVIHGIELLSKMSDDELLKLKKVYIEKYGLFLNMISEGNIIHVFLDEILANTDLVRKLLDQSMQSDCRIQLAVNNLKKYLEATKRDSEIQYQDRIIDAQIDPKKYSEFKQLFINGYNKNKGLIEHLISKGRIVYSLDKKKKFFGRHILIEKEAFVNFSDISYSSIASSYGQDIAQIEEYLVGKRLLENKDVVKKQLYSTANLLTILDGFIDNLTDTDNYVIMIMSSISAQSVIVNSDRFIANKSKTQVFSGMYRNIKVYATNLGTGHAVILFNINDVKIIYSLPETSKGEYICDNEHISYLVDVISPDELKKLTKKQGKNEAYFQKYLRFWSYTLLDVEVSNISNVTAIKLSSDSYVNRNKKKSK